MFLFFLSTMTLLMSLYLLGASPGPTSQKAAKNPTTKAASPVKLPKGIGIPPEAVDGVKGLIITYSGGMKSYFEPCGCQADMLGGIPRLATLFEGYQTAGLKRLSIDAGNIFFEFLKISKTKKVQNELKAKMLADFFRENHIKIAGVGPYDLVAGLPFLRKLEKIGKLQLVLSNARSLKTKKSPFAKHILVKHQGTTLGLLALTAPSPKLPDKKETFPKKFWSKRGLEILEPIAAAREQVKILKKKGAQRIILLSTLGLAKVEDLLGKVKGIDIVLDALEGIGFAQPKTMGKTLLLSGPKKGQKIGVLGLYAKNAAWPWAKLQTAGQAKSAIAGMQKQIKGYLRQAHQMEKQGPAFKPIAKIYYNQAKDLQNKIKALQKNTSSKPSLKAKHNGYIHFLIPLSKKLPEQAKTLSRIERYQKEVKKANLALLGKIKKIPTTKDGNSYVGAQKCKMCHQPAYNFWKKTKHAIAYNTLVKKHKQFDLDCINCHVVGWQKPGGLYNIKNPGHLGGVQCESCHSYGALHMKTTDKKKIVRNVPESTCRGCHKDEHDPHFSFQKKLKLILGKGHGYKRLQQLLKAEKKGKK